MRARILLLLLAAAGIQAGTMPGSLPLAQAQDLSTVRDIPAADSVLALGLAAWDEGEARAAQRHFEHVRAEWPQSTVHSAATLMAARAAYEMGQFDRARGLVNAFSSRYPGSSYATEADVLLATIERAEQFLRERPIRIGVLLPMTDNAVVASQELFNGLHLAVRHINANTPDSRPVELVFRDIGATPDSARLATRELASAGVDVLWGTLFSEEALAVAGEAERIGIPFLAPMATDPEVSRGRQFVFQANPTMAVRGELLARLAINGLRMDSVGVVAEFEPDDLSEQMVDAFVTEVSRLGGRINLLTFLPDERGWFELSDHFPADTLRHVEALLMPVFTDNPERTIGGILSSLDMLGRDTRILGNAAWHDLPMTSHAGKYTTTYINDFSPPQVDLTDHDAPQAHARSFVKSFRALARHEPGRLAWAGYDTGMFLMEVVQAAPFDADARMLARAIREAPRFDGLAHRIGFEGTSVNRAVYYYRYSFGQLTLLR